MRSVDRAVDGPSMIAGLSIDVTGELKDEATGLATNNELQYDFGAVDWTVDISVDCGNNRLMPVCFTGKIWAFLKLLNITSLPKLGNI